jgi:hypothetical protein
MPHANRPSGPGKPINERRDSVAEQEELDELSGDNSTPGAAAEPESTDAGPGARNAERAAHTKDENATAASGTSRDRRRQP